MADPVKYPIPAGVEAMSKEQIWEWMARSQHAHQQLNDLDRQLFCMTTRLHPSYSKLWDKPWAVIDLQARRIQGLELQMAQMQKGYKKKFAKLLKPQGEAK